MANIEGTVALTIESYEAMKREIAEAKLRAAEAEAQAREIALRDPTNTIQDLWKALQNARQIIGFAVANLHPENTPKWPWQPLHELSQFMRTFAGCDSDAQSQGADWALFVTEILDFEHRRRLARALTPEEQAAEDVEYQKRLAIAGALRRLQATGTPTLP